MLFQCWTFSQGEKIFKNRFRSKIKEAKVVFLFQIILAIKIDLHSVNTKKDLKLRGGSRILVRGAVEFDPIWGPWAQKVAQNRLFSIKLPDNCMISKKKSWGPLDPLVKLYFCVLCIGRGLHMQSVPKDAVTPRVNFKSALFCKLSLKSREESLLWSKIGIWAAPGSNLQMQVPPSS